MTLAKTAALLQIAAGAPQLRHPRGALRLFGYPDATLGPRLVVRVLGLRHLAQGAAELTGNRTLLQAGAVIDATHAATALLYARHSPTGQRAGRRNAALALTFTTLQLLAAHRAPHRQHGVLRSDEGGPADDQKRDADQPPAVARVSGPSAGAWPQPFDAQQHVLVEYGRQSGPLVRLEGGAMDGATVALAPGENTYRITDTEKGRLIYGPERESDDPEGIPALRLQPPGGDIADESIDGVG